MLKLMKIAYYNTVWMTYINEIKAENWNEGKETTEKIKIIKEMKI